MPGHRIAKETFKNQQLYKKYSCLSCDSLLRDAVQSVCGHWFCESCISLQLNTKNPKCPSCSENLKSDEGAEGSPGYMYFPDKFVRQDINALEMMCVYSDKGCDWEGTFAKLEGHLVDCEYSVCETCQQKLTTVPSEHECMLRDEGAFFCPLMKMGCPAGRFATKEKLELHMKEAEILHCELQATSITSMGISTETAAKSPPKFTARQSPQDTTLDGRIGTLDAPGVLMTPAQMVQEIDGLRRELKLLNEELTSLRAQSTQLESNRSGYKMCYRVYLNGDGELVEGQSSLKTGVQQELNESLWSTVQKLEKAMQSRNVDFEDRDLLIENSNHDGTIVWKIPQFGQRMADAQSGPIFSQPFYTGHYGYKMCLRLYILGDGIGKGNYMSLFFVLMKGEFDNIQKWPFTHKVTFKLLNQGNSRGIVKTFQPDPMSTSFRRPRSDMNIPSGCPCFVSHVDLNNGDFLVDDTLFIKCVVDTKTSDDPVFIKCIVDTSHFL